MSHILTNGYQLGGMGKRSRDAEGSGALVEGINLSWNQTNKFLSLQCQRKAGDVCIVLPTRKYGSTFQRLFVYASTKCTHDIHVFHAKHARAQLAVQKLSISANSQDLNIADIKTS